LLTSLQLGELLRYRELLRNLVVRDLKLRYRNSVLGFFWSLVNPLLMMVVLTIVFAVLLRNRSIPNFPVFVLIGILVWNLHTSCLVGATGSVVAAAPLVNKIYFPRIMLPASVVLANLVNFLLSLVAYTAVAIFFSIQFSGSLLLFPLILLAQLLFSLGLAFLVSVLNVYYRDTQIILETVLLGWFFLTPVFYRMEDLFPDYARLVYIVNPMASLVEAYRAVLYAGGMPDLYFFGRTFATCLVVAAVGLIVFQRFAPRLSEEL
jgi:ABC-type polysaccharide/polyol phosphate export permease